MAATSLCAGRSAVRHCPPSYPKQKCAWAAARLGVLAAVHAAIVVAARLAAPAAVTAAVPPAAGPVAARLAITTAIFAAGPAAIVVRSVTHVLGAHLVAALAAVHVALRLLAVGAGIQRRDGGGLGAEDQDIELVLQLLAGKEELVSTRSAQPTC